MDRTQQVYESDTQGWQRALYQDIKTTLRAPLVNSIWRTQLYHAPEFLRYAWGQLKPVFETRQFAAYSVAYRDTLCAPFDDRLDVYDPATVELSPRAFTELRGQLAAFDVVGPRLMLLFTLVDRQLRDEPVGEAFDPDSPRATAPFPEWLDTDRGHPPTMLPQSTARDRLPEALTGEFGAMVPSIYRCLAQWPSYLDRAWADVKPVMTGDAYERAHESALALTETCVDRLAYTPRLRPDDLTNAGFATETVEELRELYAAFLSGAETVVPLLTVYAATVGATGERDALTVDW
jgi:Halocarboxylic acid dehydrogenase DehI.